jgi:hypothetical protein
MSIVGDCPKCKKGILRDTGRILTSYPPYFVFVCESCGEQTTIRSDEL